MLWLRSVGHTRPVTVLYSARVPEDLVFDAEFRRHAKEVPWFRYVPTVTRLAPEITADWPPLRDEATLVAGVEERRGAISEVWTWIGHHELQDDAAARLFGEASFATVSERFEQTADELWAVFGTTSLYHRLSLEVRERFRADVERIADGLGGRVTSTQLLLLASARRRPD